MGAGGFSGKRKAPTLGEKETRPPWVQLIGEGGLSRNQTVVDEAGNSTPRVIPRKRAWRPAGWPALHLAYVHRIGVADPEGSRRATRAPWAERRA